MKRKWARGSPQERGSVMILTALLMVVILGFASLAIDVGRLYVVRNELQNAVDASALAGASNLIKDQNGEAVRDCAGAGQAAMSVAQRQAELLGLPPVDPGARNDLTIVFGEWNIYAANPETAWTELGSSCGSYSSANAVKVTLRRGSGLTFGPVTNFLARILGSRFQTSEVAATATAFLGYAGTAETGSVTLPLAVPDSVLSTSSLPGHPWYAELLGPREARAATVRQLTFKDLGSDSFYLNNLQRPLFDTQKAYLFIVNSSDSVPSTVVDNIKRSYSTTSGKAIRAMAQGTPLFPLSEYQWASNIKTIFSQLRTAYNTKKDSNGKWRVCVPVYSTTNPMAKRPEPMFLALLKWLNFAPSHAHACFSFWKQTYPGGNVPIYVTGFVNVDVTKVTYNSGCTDCSSYYPYSSTVDCMVNNPGSCRNANSITMEIPLGSSTVSPPGTTSGGPDNSRINPGGAANQGAVAAIPRLVK
ncbi:MAG: hypothetical protein FJ128_06310 [Deltaproteobacteria bacterium]|nr:hypothetical protein [Deltaproteobacteria bacterium]